MTRDSGFSTLSTEAMRNVSIFCKARLQTLQRMLQTVDYKVIKVNITKKEKVPHTNLFQLDNRERKAWCKGKIVRDVESLI